MDHASFVARLRLDRSLIEDIVAWSPQKRDALITYIKNEADRHWWIDLSESLAFASLIIDIGSACDDNATNALGLMARGDALKFAGHVQEAWQLLDQAGELFRQADQMVGWARTRIGRLLLSPELNQVPQALQDAEQARQLFVLNDRPDLLLRLDHNLGSLYYWIGDYNNARAAYERALERSEQIGEPGQQMQGLLFADLGNLCATLGQVRSAQAYHRRAEEVCARYHQAKGLALAKANLADLYRNQGHVAEALAMLYEVRQSYIQEDNASDVVSTDLQIIECQLLLNRYVEVRDTGYHLIAILRQRNQPLKEAFTLLLVATAETALNNYDAALAALNTAETLFLEAHANNQLATVWLHHAQLALKTMAIGPALKHSEAAAAVFAEQGKQIEYGIAQLYAGQAHLAAADPDAARSHARLALGIARTCGILSLRYSTYLLLGRIALLGGQQAQARRRFQAAVATVERVQHTLTITLRSGFLEDKGEALRELIGLELRQGNNQRAFEALERTKAQALLNYFADHNNLRWNTTSPRGKTLLDELSQLREEHQWFYNSALDITSDQQKSHGLTTQTAISAIKHLEQRMREITDQLYLLSSNTNHHANVNVPPLPTIQRHLDDNSAMLAFYTDGQSFWAFVIDADSITVHALPISVPALTVLIKQIQMNFAVATRVGPGSPTIAALTKGAQSLLQTMYRQLLQPTQKRFDGKQRMYIVPYGPLHFVPFHTLYTSNVPFIQQSELIILPTASLITRERVRRSYGALSVAHTWNGRLPHTISDAQAVQRRFGGQLFVDQQATSTVLQAEPLQILHIAAHGEHRLDQPDLSYIQLHDRQLMTTDVLQHDLSYELVTLSACETGRATVSGGDELIGIGRGFLYAGAGALITSLWPVIDSMTCLFMERLYTLLHGGHAKSAALRHVQLEMLQTPSNHPAFWGAFQLMGDPAPLSGRRG